jgi:hypothetical protein
MLAANVTLGVGSLVGYLVGAWILGVICAAGWRLSRRGPD